MYSRLTGLRIDLTNVIKMNIKFIETKEKQVNKQYKENGQYGTDTLEYIKDKKDQ
jgi:hypothetical protein